jgi:superfamily II DNA or RNA helicase
MIGASPIVVKRLIFAQFKRVSVARIGWYGNYLDVQGLLSEVGEDRVKEWLVNNLCFPVRDTPVCLYQKAGVDRLLIPRGFTQRFYEFLRSIGYEQPKLKYPVRFTADFSQDILSRLRDYQVEVLRSLVDWLSISGAGSVMMATGGGKTYMIGALIKHLIDTKQVDRVFALAPSIDLVLQMADWIRKWGVDDVGVVTHEEFGLGKVTVATVQTMFNALYETQTTVDIGVPMQLSMREFNEFFPAMEGKRYYASVHSQDFLYWILEAMEEEEEIEREYNEGVKLPTEEKVALAKHYLCLDIGINKCRMLVIVDEIQHEAARTVAYTLLSNPYSVRIGLSACVTGNTLVPVLEEGRIVWRKIRELEGKQVTTLAFDGIPGSYLSFATAVVLRTELGDRKIYRIRTESGREVLVTEDHPFFVAERGLVPWVPAKELKPKMMVLVVNPSSGRIRTQIPGVTIGYELVTDVEEVDSKGDVYDMSVDGFHNFVANGFITHNTPWRADDWTMHIYAVAGEIIPRRVTSSELISRGYLVPAVIIMYKRRVDVNSFLKFVETFHPDKLDALRERKLQATTEYNLIKEFLYKYDEDRYKDALRIASTLKRYELTPAMFMMKERMPAAVMHDMLVKSGFTSYLVTGSVKGSLRKEIFDLARERKLDFIVTTVVGDEGLDIPPLRALVKMGSSTSPVRIFQRIGRVLRPWEGKRFGLVIDFWDDILYFTFQGLMRERAYRLEKNWTILLAKNVDGVEGAIRWALRTFSPKLLDEVANAEGGEGDGTD